MSSLRESIVLRRVIQRAVGGCGAALLCTLAFANSATTPAPAEPASSIAIPDRQTGVTGDKDAMSDESFSHAAALVNLGELELSRIALERSRNLRVKLLADRVVKDRQAIDTTLQAIAKRKNMKLPEKLGLDEQAAVSALKLQPKESFDTAYVMQMREDNVKAIALFEQAKSNTSLSAEVREMAGASLKILLASQQQTLAIEVPVKPAKEVVPEPV